jgi:roadblock/LC7 domain-containing protein
VDECLKTQRAFVVGTAAHRLVCFAAIALTVLGGVFYRKAASEFLNHRLSYVRHLPDLDSTNNDVIYVLGGNEESLEAKFRTASNLIRDGNASRVLVFSEPMLMAFSPALGRNLTFDEWAVVTLGAFGVNADAIEFVSFEEGFFGTWSEAKGLSRLAGERGYRRLILVTSPFHSRRVWESFSHTVEHADTRLYLYLTDETVYLRYLIPEYFKLLFYRAFLL